MSYMIYVIYMIYMVYIVICPRRERFLGLDLSSTYPDPAHHLIVTADTVSTCT